LNQAAGINYSRALEDAMNKSALITRKLTPIIALFLLLSVVVSCRMVESLTGTGKAGTVSNLWPDVPPFEGATKTDLQIPMIYTLALRAAMQGKISFIAFNTNKTAQDVQDFYTADRMKAAGWAPNEKGCVGNTEDKTNQGVMCFFQRKDGAKQEGLAIIVAESEKEKKTDIFYARIDMTQPTPSPSR
jgi:hypothetical protein